MNVFPFGKLNLRIFLRLRMFHETGPWSPFSQSNLPNNYEEHFNLNDAYVKFEMCMIFNICNARYILMVQILY